MYIVQCDGQISVRLLRSKGHEVKYIMFYICYDIIYINYYTNDLYKTLILN